MQLDPFWLVVGFAASLLVIAWLLGTFDDDR